MLLPILLLALLTWISAPEIRAQTQPPITRCDDLPSVQPNFTIMVANSPYHTMWSSQGQYNCTTGLLTGPGPTYGNNYTWITLYNYKVKALFSVTPSNGNSTLYSKCKDGRETHFRFMAFTESYYITYVCSSKGKKLRMFRGYGHLANDSLAMQTIIQTNLDRLNVGQNNMKQKKQKKLINTFQNCGFRQYCQNYFQ